MKKERPDKIEYYLNMAEMVADRSTCMRRKYGAIIVKNDEVIATGYNGAPRGKRNCCDLDKCFREDMKIPQGSNYELCRSVHAEMNAIISASRERLQQSTIYLVGLEDDEARASKKRYTNAKPCLICARLILNAGIVRIVARNKSGGFDDFLTNSAWFEWEPKGDIKK